MESPIRFRPSPDLFPFESHWFESSVGPVHYIDVGEGRPIVFFHGNPTWCFLYRKVIGALQSHYRCIAVDYPGFGLSVRPMDYGYSPAEHAKVMSEFVDHLGIEDFMIMGQDWGGPIGLSVAASRPEAVTGLILGNTWFWPTDRLLNKIFSRVMSSSPMQRRILERNFFIDRLIPMGSGSLLSDYELDQYRGAQPFGMRQGQAEFPRQLMSAGPWLATLYEQVVEHLSRKRLLLVWGMKDIVFHPNAFLPKIRRVFHDSAMVQLPKAKHYIQEDAPGEIAQAILQHFY
ncbi:MAG TPA: alpha/beta fold hydrolase [Actinomycetota bacterium]|nr:alpha/beta fold hydrolase [Actinomycetota bacterium]